MLKLRLLNAVAPAYFFIATAVTFILHFCFFIPTIFPNSDTSLKSSTTLHTIVFLFLIANETGVPVCSPHCSDKVDAHYLLNNRHFCKLCKKVILKRDHHCFFTGNCIGNKNMRYFLMFCIYTSCICMYCLVLGVAFLTVEYEISFENPLTFLTLLPLSTGYFFMGTISGLQLFLVLMLYVWLGIGLVCAGFCCQQVLLVARGQTWCQMQRGQLVENRSPWRSNLKDVFGTRWILGLVLPLQTVETGDRSHILV
uniref:Palmitoyltransferase n=1 Tax=Labrus bergylta TaxID=56723 RepID=A0A3Q3L0D6_9LABR